MNNIFFNISGKIDQQTVEALTMVKRIADSLSIPFFIVGASARDFILEHSYGIKPRRMTKDIDLGVEVASWEQFDQLKDSLIATGRFSPDKKEKQRFHCNSIIFDIVPFGSITDEDRKISWPPEHEIFMSMFGFKEAYEHSVVVRLSTDPPLDVKVPTLPGLALMKIISWNDRPSERQRDADDLLFIMHKYEDAGNRERLFDEEQSMLMEEKFYTQLAGIRLLGRDMARISDPETLRVVIAILENETGEQSQYRLVTDMIRGALMFNESFEEILRQVEKLKQGIVEVADKLDT
jgi:predicted nucleotidyltransferase